MTIKFNASVSDNGSKKFVSLDSDNVSVSMVNITIDSVYMSFNNLSYIAGLMPDNETYLCGQLYWTGVEHEISSCNFKNWNVFDIGTIHKNIMYVSDNETFWEKIGDSTFPDSFGCERLDRETTENYIYPACESSSSSSTSLVESGPGLIWSMVDDLASENDLNDNGSFVVRLKSHPNNDVSVNLKNCKCSRS